MSEPRKLHTGGASGGQYSAPRQPGSAGNGMQDQDQYEAARRRAQQLANQNAHRRLTQQPVRTAQGRHIRQTPPQPVEEPVQQPVGAQTPPPAPEPEAPRELTHAQKQALAYRAAAERKYGNTVRFPAQRRTVRQPSQPAQSAGRPRTQVQHLDVRNTQGSKPAYDYTADAPAKGGGIQMEQPQSAKRRAPEAQVPTEKTTHRAAKGGSGGGRKPPRDE